MNEPSRTPPAWKRWLPAGVWAVVIFAASSLPGSAVPTGASAWGHLAEYAVLAVLVIAAERRRGLAAAAFIALAVVALYGATDELHQMLVPTRVPDVMDWLTDLAGAVIGIVCWWAVSGVRAWRAARNS